MVYLTLPNMNSGGISFSFCEPVRNEAAKNFAVAVRERIEFAELKTVLKMEIMIEFPVGISSFEIHNPVDLLNGCASCHGEDNEGFEG
jgi:hypothetical protein